MQDPAFRRWSCRADSTLAVSRSAWRFGRYPGKMATYSAGPKPMSRRFTILARPFWSKKGSILTHDDAQGLLSGFVIRFATAAGASADHYRLPDETWQCATVVEQFHSGRHP